MLPSSPLISRGLFTCYMLLLQASLGKTPSMYVHTLLLMHSPNPPSEPPRMAWLKILIQKPVNVLGLSSMFSVYPQRDDVRRSLYSLSLGAWWKRLNQQQHRSVFSALCVPPWIVLQALLLCSWGALKRGRERRGCYGLAAAPCIVSIWDIGGQVADNITAQEGRRGLFFKSPQEVLHGSNLRVLLTFANNNSLMEIMFTCTGCDDTLAISRTIIICIVC